MRHPLLHSAICFPVTLALDILTIGAQATAYGACQKASHAAALSSSSEVGIANHPTSVTARAGAAATFSVVATGAQPLGYQWKKNGEFIPGATRSTYTVPRATAAEVAAYEVFVYNAYGSATSNAAQLSVAGERGISLEITPGQSATGVLTVVKGTGGSVRAAVDPIDPLSARTTYQIVRLSGSGMLRIPGTSAPVPSGGTLDFPLRFLGESGEYAIEYTREYADGSPAYKVLSEPFLVAAVSFENAAGVYELLLEDFDRVIPDGATYRGRLLVTISKSGTISGRLLYNEAHALSGAEHPPLRVYTPVARSFSGVFTTSPLATDKLVCSPKLGLGAQAGRQILSLELDFTTTPVALKAYVVDRTSVPPEVTAKGAHSVAAAVTRNLTKLAGVTNLQNEDLRTAVGRFNAGSALEISPAEGPRTNSRAILLMQVLPSGRVLWVSRLPGYSGSGSAGLRQTEDGPLAASFYEGFLKTSAKLHHSDSLLAAIQLQSLPDGRWDLRMSAGSDSGFIERQSSYIAKNNDIAEHSERFAAAAFGTKDFNWSHVHQIDFSAGNSCLWSGSTKAGLMRHFSLPQPATPESAPRLCTLTLEDPAETTPHAWHVSISNTGSVRTTPLVPGQSELSLRFDKLRGEFRGSYVSPKDTIRRTIVGAALLDPAESLLRARGWVELNALPATKTAKWKLELTPP